MADMESTLDLERFGVPISNKENKKLEAVVKEKEKEILNRQNNVDLYRDRIEAITGHLKNVKQELGHTLSLLDARKKDVDTEEHIHHIDEREEGRLKAELKRIRLEREELKEQRNTYENTKFLLEKKAKDVKEEMKWDEQALMAWLEESARQNEDALTIAKYAKVDENKVKELSLNMERLHEDTTKKRKILDNEVVETMAVQIELDKTAEEFRRAHQEREELIGQWEKTIEQMKKRDESMNKCANDLAVVNGEIKEKKTVANDKQEFLDREKGNNVEKEKMLQTTERQVAKCRLQLQSDESSNTQLKDELETLKFTVEREATDLDKAKSERKQLGRDMEDKKVKLENLSEQRQHMQLGLKKTIKETLTAEQRAQQLDDMLAQEDFNVVQLKRTLDQLGEKQFASSQECFELKTKAKTMGSELEGNKAATRNLASKQHKLDQESLKQQQILYTQDFQVQQLQHKLARLEGERSGEELDHLNAQIKQLEEEWSKQESDELLLKNQLKRLQEDLRRVNRAAERELKKKLGLEEKTAEMELHIDTTQRELKRVVAAKQDKMVEENIFKLGVKRLQDHLYARADEVHSLEKRKLQLNTAMGERMNDISIYKDMLKSQLKAAETERQTHSSELHSQLSKIDMYKKRYEIVTMSMLPPEGEEQHSSAYYVIKAAQEREDLTRKGDELDTKIKKAEGEIAAMTNTLSLLNTKNQSHRKTLNKLDESSDQYELYKALEAKCTKAQDTWKQKKRSLQHMEEDINTMKHTLSSLKVEEGGLLQTLEENQNILASYSKDKEELKAKHDRVARQTSKLLRELFSKEKVCGHTPTHVHRDIEVRELREFGGGVVKRLGSLAAQHLDMVPNLQLLFSQVGLPPPASPATSKASSVVSSARSSVSSFSARMAAAHHQSGSSTPTQRPSKVDIVLGSTSTTPLAGVSPRSVASPGRSKPGGSHSGSSSLASSRHSTRTPSASSSSSRRGRGPQKKGGPDLSIGPSRR